MTRTVLLMSVAAFAATPLAAQHAHPAAPPAPPAPTPAAAASTPRPMSMPGGAKMMMPGMDSMMPMGSMMGMGSLTGMDSMMAPLHALLAYAPQRLLERRGSLQLDGDQESRLVRIAAAGQAAHDSALAAAAHHQHALETAVAGVPDAASVTAHFEAMHAAMGAAHAAMLRAALEARAALTSGQRSLVEPAAAHNHEGGS